MGEVWNQLVNRKQIALHRLGLIELQLGTNKLSEVDRNIFLSRKCEGHWERISVGFGVRVGFCVGATLVFR